MLRRKKIKVNRHPILGTVHFQSCNLCYGKPNCCPHISSCCIPILISKDYAYWSKLTSVLHQCQIHGDAIRLITERPLPNEILWEAAYSESNIFQANINILQDWECIKWVASLAHKAERCGVGCLLMVYPILPLRVKTYQVLKLLDAVNTCKHCKIMVRFGEFINYGLPIHSGFIKLDGYNTPLSLINRIDGNIWGCTDNYKFQFMNYLKFYADANNIDLRMCEVIRCDS